MNRWWKPSWKPLSRSRNSWNPSHGRLRDMSIRNWFHRQPPWRTRYRPVPLFRYPAKSGFASYSRVERPISSQARFFHNSRNYSSDCHVVSVYFTNFPDSWKACHFWDILNSFGEIVDVFIPYKRNSRGQKFGFIHFVESVNVDRLLSSLNLIWIGGFKPRFFLAKHCPRTGKQRFAGNSSHENCPKPIMNSNLENVFNNPLNESPLEDNVELGSNQNLCPKDVSRSEVVVEDPISSLPCHLSCSSPNQASVSMEDGFVVIKVKFADLLKLQDSGLIEKLIGTVAPSSVCRAIDFNRHVPIKERLDLSFPSRSFRHNRMMDVEHSRLRILQLPLSLNLSSFANWSTSLCFGSKAASNHSVKLASLGNGSFPPSPPEQVLIEDNMHNVVDDECNELGSPCFSLHPRSTEEINMILGGDPIYKETSQEDDSEAGNSLLIVNGGAEANCDELAFFYDTVSSNTFSDTEPDYVFDNVSVPDGRELSMPSDVSLVAHVLDDSINHKVPKKKKKRSKNNWSRKKSHSKAPCVNSCPIEIKESDNLITDKDIQLRNEMFRKEAIKTLEVGHLLGMSFEGNDDMIINKLMDLEYEEWKANSSN